MSLLTGADPQPRLRTARACWATLRRELLVQWRRGSDWLNPLIFFLLAITLIPLGLGPERRELAALAPGLLWIMALLATLLSLDSLFRADFEDGTLEQLVISPHPLWLLVLVKVFSHWLTTGLPLTLLAPLLGIMLALPEPGFSALWWSLLLGTPTLSLIGAIGAALTVSLRGSGGLLLSLIVMPLYVPVLIFGASAVQTAVDGIAIDGQLAVLGAFLALAVALAPLACAGAIQLTIDG